MASDLVRTCRMQVIWKWCWHWHMHDMVGLGQEEFSFLLCHDCDEFLIYLWNLCHTHANPMERITWCLLAILQEQCSRYRPISLLDNGTALAKHWLHGWSTWSWTIVQCIELGSSAAEMKYFTHRESWMQNNLEGEFMLLLSCKVGLIYKYGHA